jgi:hypothetical protein
MHNPYVAILVAALAAWLFGALWYGLLGRAWMAAQGMSEAEIDARRQVRKMPLGPMAVSFVCELVMALIFSWLLAGLGVGDLTMGALTGLLVGGGFMVTTTVTNNVFPGRKRMLSVIDGAHWVAVAVIECLILVALS